MIISTDILVIGGGLAGMLASMEAARSGQQILLLSKGPFGRSGSSYICRAGFSVVLDNDADSTHSHFEDTIRSGQGLCDPELVRVFAEQAPHLVRALEQYGVRFHKESGRFLPYLGGGHSHARMVYTVNKNGPDMTLPLAERVRSAANISVRDNTAVLSARSCGTGFFAICMEAGQVFGVTSKALVMSTGGAGRLYRHTRTPADATGDGFALALMLGAELVDIEFIQHYPLEVVWPIRADLHADIAANLPALGAVSRNRHGEAFMPSYDERGELATRDVHARAFFWEIAKGNGAQGGVWLDLSAVRDSDLEDTIPDYYAYFVEQGIPKTEWRVAVAPGAHYYMGGIRIDTRCQSSVEGLFACGEAASGLHGANRLACNSLPECVVFGHIAGRSAAEHAAAGGAKVPRLEAEEVEDFLARNRDSFSQASNLQAIEDELRDVMWDKAGLVRHDTGLEQALQSIERLSATALTVASPGDLPHLYAVRNMLMLARAIASAARMRRESRGSHYRSDFPHADPGWQQHIVHRLDQDAMIAVVKPHEHARDFA